MYGEARGGTGMGRVAIDKEKGWERGVRGGGGGCAEITRRGYHTLRGWRRQSVARTCTPQRARTEHDVIEKRYTND